MTFETWLLFVITEVVLSVTPGPAVLFVLSQGKCGGTSRCLGALRGMPSPLNVGRR